MELNEVDLLSYLLTQLLKIIGVTHPIRVCTALALGTSSRFFWKLGMVVYPDSVIFKELYQLPTYYLCLFFVALFMLPIAFGNKGTPDEISHNIRAVDALVTAAKLSSAQRKMVWNSVISKYLEGIKPNLRPPGDLDIKSIAEKEIDNQQNMGIPVSE
jgi:hypothetical protein